MSGDKPTNKPIEKGDGGSVSLGAGGDPGPFPESPTATLLARLFGVPIVIVSVIVGCAVLVVLLFGGITEPPRRSIDELLTTLEQNTGERSLGVLFTQEKELWQVAQELALRLQKKQTELTGEEMDSVVGRLSKLLREDAERVANVVPGDDEVRQKLMRRQRLHYVMHALAQTGDPRVVVPLAERLEDEAGMTRREAVRALAWLHGLPEAAAMAGRVAGHLEDSDETVRMMAAAALSSLGRADDPVVMAGLAQSLVDESVEVQWNAALTLARLGSDRGRLSLMDLLDRSFLEKDGLSRVVAEDGSVRRGRLTPGRVVTLLETAMKAAAHLEDETLWGQIEKLSQDVNPSVVDCAKKLLAKRGETAGELGGLTGGDEKLVLVAAGG